MSVLKTLRESDSPYGKKSEGHICLREMFIDTASQVTICNKTLGKETNRSYILSDRQTDR